jgi:hypothetical protein
MELNDESEGGVRDAESATPAGQRGGSAKPKPKPEPEPEPEAESESEAKFEAELEADVSEYETELAAAAAEGTAKVEKEEIAREYEAPYVPAGPRDEDKHSLLRRLSPYLTVAGILLIVRIVFYSLRRRRR